MKKAWLPLLAAIGFWANIAFAINPIINYHYLADPTAFVIDDTFWIICDLDDESVTGYNIKAYYALSSKDMVNWTDHGEVFRVPRDVSWAGAAWAPAAAYRNGKVYIYYPNGTGGVGVAVANTPVGPFKDPVGKAIVDHNAANGNYCDDVVWCFDPGVFIDTDGQAYLIWGGGGGETGKAEHDHNFRMMKLNSDMISLSGSLIKVDITNNSGSDWTKSFEAPYITKRNGTYYLSYNTRGQTIGYATGTSPTGPWTYKGVALENPKINGTNINANNNNHHGFAEFKGKWYAAYHDRRLAIAKGDSKPDLHRNVSIDLLEYNADGTIKSLTFTNEGPAAIGNFNPYDSIPATTGSKMNGVGSKTVLVTNAPPYSMLTPLPSLTSWERISNVDFGTSGATTFQVSAASLNANNKVEIRVGSESGAIAGTCSLPQTGSWSSFQTTECAVSGLTGVIPLLYIKFTGTTDSSAGIKWWRFTGNGESSSSSAGTSSSAASSSSTARSAYSSATIPGTIEAENYDMGNEGDAYHDEDASNKGGVYRHDGVDIVGEASSGYKVGYTASGEWLEYSVQVLNDGIFNWQARVSSGAQASSFRMLLDNVAISDSIKIPQGADWDTYTNVSGTTPALTAGEHVLRIIVDGAWFNLDWLSFVNASDPTPIYPFQQDHSMSRSTYTVYNIHGHQEATFTLEPETRLEQAVAGVVTKSGLYIVRPHTMGVARQVMVP